jgi:predicted nucleic acid-binding Zn ribbon protein
MNARIKARVLEEWRGLPETPFPKDTSQPIARLLPVLLGKLGLQERIREEEILSAWKEVVGDFLAQHATPAGLREGVLSVRVVQSTVQFELERMWRSRILQKLQARFGRSQVRDIRFRIG